MPETVRIEYLPLSKVIRWPRNPKLHSLEDLHASFNRFGFVSPLILDERSKKLIAGHGRLDALQGMFDRGEAPPARIQVRQKQWFVPVIRGLSFKDDKEAEAYLLADNQLTIAEGFDPALLAVVLPDHQLNLTGLGFSDEELRKFLPQYRTVELEPKPKEEAGALGFTVAVDVQTMDEANKVAELLKANGYVNVKILTRLKSVKLLPTHRRQWYKYKAYLLPPRYSNRNPKADLFSS